MEEKRVSTETAYLAKDKGFDELTEVYLDEYGKPRIIERYSGVFWAKNSKIQYNCRIFNIFKKDKLKGMITLPTQSILQLWLRKNHNIHVNVFEQFGDYILLIHHYNSSGDKINIWKHKGPHLSYEKGLELGLFEGLRLIKMKISR